MWHPYDTKRGVAQLAIVALLFLSLLAVERPWLSAGQTWLIWPALFVLLVGLVVAKFFVLRGVRLDETGLTVQKRLLPDVSWTWEELRVSHRRRKRRSPGGLVIESAREETAVAFLPLDGLHEGEALLSALQQRLGTRYEG